MAYSTTRSTFFCPAGTKWYWEFVPTTNYNYASCGITTNSAAWDVNPGGTTDGHGVGFYDVEIDIDGTRTTPSGPASTAWASGDIIGFAYDVDANTIKKYINGSLDYTYSSVPVSTDGPYSPTFGDFGGSVAATINVNFGQDSSFGGLKTAQGNQDGNSIGDFYYEPPSGYLALCTSNLSDPEIADPTDHFNTTIWTGDTSTYPTSRSLTGVGFKPDFVWAKVRSTTGNSSLYDAVRGAEEYLASSESDGETNQPGSGYLTSFDSDGSSWADGTSNGNNYNQNAATYVSWNWKGDNVSGGTLNEDGSIDSYVNVNTTAGFSIVKYTSPGSDSDETIGHGLAQRPDMVMVKNRDSAYNWDVWTPALSSGYDLKLNDNAAQASGRWSTTIPTASLVTLKDTYEVAGTDEYIAYCFHSVEGYSKVMEWSGNSDTDGVFLYCGFRPSFFIGKCISASESWFMLDNKRDTYNDEYKRLFAESNAAESTGDPDILDFVSNGIKFRNSGNNGNVSGRDYMGIAFAESPFKTANAR